MTNKLEKLSDEERAAMYEIEQDEATRSGMTTDEETRDAIREGLE